MPFWFLHCRSLLGFRALPPTPPLLSCCYGGAEVLSFCEAPLPAFLPISSPHNWVSQSPTPPPSGRAPLVRNFTHAAKPVGLRRAWRCTNIEKTAPYFQWRQHQAHSLLLLPGLRASLCIHGSGQAPWRCMRECRAELFAHSKVSQRKLGRCHSRCRAGGYLPRALICLPEDRACSVSPQGDRAAFGDGLSVHSFLQRTGAETWQGSKDAPSPLQNARGDPVPGRTQPPALFLPQSLLFTPPSREQMCNLWDRGACYTCLAPPLQRGAGRGKSTNWFNQRVGGQGAARGRADTGGGRCELFWSWTKCCLNTIFPGTEHHKAMGAGALSSHTSASRDPLNTDLVRTAAACTKEGI